MILGALSWDFKARIHIPVATHFVGSKLLFSVWATKIGGKYVSGSPAKDFSLSKAVSMIGWKSDARKTCIPRGYFDKGEKLVFPQTHLK